MKNIENLFLSLFPGWMLRLLLEWHKTVEVAIERESGSLKDLRCYKLRVQRVTDKIRIFGVPVSIPNLIQQISKEYNLHIAYGSAHEKLVRIFFLDEPKTYIYRINVRKIKHKTEGLMCARCQKKEMKFSYEIERAVKPWIWVSQIKLTWDSFGYGKVCSMECANQAFAAMKKRNKKK
jgi:hypothetical protein